MEKIRSRPARINPTLAGNFHGTEDSSRATGGAQMAQKDRSQVCENVVPVRPGT